MKSKARNLRKNQTDAERLLWHHLRGRRMVGHKFRRQHPIGSFIVDFACVESRFIIELDGGQHAWHVEQDQERSAYLESRGYRVVRFWNDQVLAEVEAVLEVILALVGTEPPHPNPWSPSAPPAAGKPLPRQQGRGQSEQPTMCSVNKNRP